MGDAAAGLSAAGDAACDGGGDGAADSADGGAASRPGVPVAGATSSARTDAADGGEALGVFDPLVAGFFSTTLRAAGPALLDAGASAIFKEPNHRTPALGRAKLGARRSLLRGQFCLALHLLPSHLERTAHFARGSRSSLRGPLPLFLQRLARHYMYDETRSSTSL